MNASKMTRLTLVAVLGLAGAACATTEPPAEAVLSFTPEAACTDQLDFATALAMTSETPVGSIRTTAALSSASPCLTGRTGAAPYAIFQLPAQDNLASVVLGAGISQTRLVPMIAEFYDSDGELSRRFTADQMRRRGMGLTVAVRPRQGEAYGVIRLDAAAVGQSYSLAGRNPRYVEAHGRPGFDFSEFERAYSFEGEVFAIAYFSDPNRDVESSE